MEDASQHATVVRSLSSVDDGIPVDEAAEAGNIDDPISEDVAAASAQDVVAPLSDESGLFFHEGFLSFASRDCIVVPEFLARFAALTTKLDLSFNSLVNVHGLEPFFQLEELILDNNELTDDALFPHLPRLKTLSLNKNKLVNLDRVVSACRFKFPQLTFLSLVGNQCCPSLHQLLDDDEELNEYQRYRYIVVHKIHDLKFLDFTPVSETERREAAKRGKFLSTVKVDEKDLDAMLASQTMETPTTTVKKNGKKMGDDDDDAPYSPLPKSVSVKADQTKEAYGKCRYVYYGKQSEGNRFIGNSDI